MSNGRKITLHIGLHKTGTTTIQNVLYANREFLLAEENVLYPSLAPNLSTPIMTIFKNDSLRQTANKMAGLTLEQAMARGRSCLDSLDDEISSREWDMLLLSGEGVSHLSVPELSRLREWGERYSADWTVLVCVRHPVDWTRSVMQERLKQGDTLKQLYEKPPTLKYDQRIANAISVFGRENVCVFDFDAATESEGGIIGNFAAKVGLSASSRDFLASRTVRTNESFSLEAAWILNSLNRRHPIFVDNVRAPNRAGPGHELPYLRRIKGRKFDVPEPVKENVRLQSRKDVVWLNETFELDLYRDVTDFTPSMEEHEEPVEALSDPAIDSIAEVLGELVTEKVFRHFLNQGRAALTRGDLERATQILQQAARLDPEAPQPQKLLKKAIAEQGVDTGKAGPQEKADKRANRTSFLSRFRR